MKATGIYRTSQGSAAWLSAVVLIGLVAVLAGCAPSSARGYVRRSTVLRPTQTAAAEFDSPAAAPAEIAMAGPAQAHQ